MADTLHRLARESVRTGKRVYGEVKIAGERISVWIAQAHIEVAQSGYGEKWNWPKDRP